MSQTFFVTEYQDGLLTGTMEDGYLSRASYFRAGKQSILGNIYVAKVIDVVKNINACFVDIAPGVKCFLPLDTCKQAILCNRQADGRILQQDTIVVQVEKEAAKSKDPYVTGKLTLTGDTCVVLNDKAGVQYSKKFSDKQKLKIKTAVEEYLALEDNRYLKDFGIIIRTDAYQENGDFAKLFSELSEFGNSMRDIMLYASKRTLYSVLFKREEPYIEELKKCGIGNYHKVVTDLPKVYEDLYAYLQKNDRNALENVVLYTDETISLKNLYHLTSSMEEILGRKVWLKCGGNLVIDELEAMTVIDVNTAKASGLKSSEENFYKVNMEACEEIAKQLVLRNLSGMIMIDFINLKNKEKEKEILNHLSSLLKKDKVTAKVIDMTPLGIVEVTRKRTYPSLKEQFGGYVKF